MMRVIELIQRLLVMCALHSASASRDHLHVFPECEDVCARLEVNPKPFFAFNIWNVTCQNQICIVQTRWYSKTVIPSKNPENFTVKYDIHVSDIEGIDIETHPQIHFWIGFLWRDENIRMCDCSGLDRTETAMDLQNELWLPDLFFQGQSFIGRIGFYSGYSQMLIHRPEDVTNTNNQDLLVFWGVHARTGVGCPAQETGIFPFDRKICMFRPVFINPGDKSIIWKRNRVSSDEIDVDGYKVTIRKLCREEAQCDSESDPSCRDMDGFKLFIERDQSTHKMNEYFRYLSQIPAFLALVILLLPTNCPKHHGVDRYEAMMEVILQVVIITFKFYRMGMGYLFAKIADTSYKVVMTSYVFMCALILTKRIHVAPCLLAFIYTWLLPSYPYKAREVSESEDDSNAKPDNLVTYDAFKEAMRMMRKCQAFISHLKPTNKIIFAVLYLNYFLHDHWFWALWKESSMFGASAGGSELVSPDCSCECDKNIPPLLPFTYN